MAGEGIDACHIYSTDGIYSVIATTDGSDYPQEIEDANARLIAAAPELLEALNLILPLALGYSPEGQTATARATCQSWVDSAQKAAAKATGAA